MRHETKKISLIINELMTIMLLDGAEDIKINIKRQNKTTEITMEYPNCEYTEEFLEQLQESLNTQRQSEVEGYYWQLCGDDDSGDELFLVGAMVDEASVEMQEKTLTIHLIRKEPDLE